MSFQYAPAQFRLPKIPKWTPPDGFWRGLGDDEGLYAFYCPEWGGHVMSRSLCYSLKVDGTELKPVFSSVNGYVHWEGGGGCVYLSQTYDWVYVTSMYPGYEPLEEVVRDEETNERTYDGDSFYKIGSFPSPGGEARMTARGKLCGKEGKTLSASWTRWVGAGEFGKYKGEDGASGEKTLGLPRFRGNGAYYVRSFAKENNGHYRYGGIRFTDGKWVLGEIGSDGGWWEGSEPSKDGSVTFRFTKSKGSEATGNDVTVSLSDYVKGEETASVMLGEVAIWR